MSNRAYRSKPARQLQLWVYLLPVVGVVPAIWTLYRLTQLKDNVTVRSDLVGLRQRQKVSRLCVSLALVWLSCYCLLSLGAASVSGIESFRLLYTNALITTGYFLACSFLMLRVNKKSLLVNNKLAKTK